MRSRTRRGIAAFTLVELLVAAAILVTMFGFLISLTDQTTRVWTSTAAKVEQFREARIGFERVTTRLAQATLNTYWDYNNPTAPTRYERRSELRFITGSAPALLGTAAGVTRCAHAVFFNAPLGIAGSTNDRGLANALNTLGYFVEFGDDTAPFPKFLKDAVAPRWRFRLMEFAQPTENFSLYDPNTLKITNGWFTTDVNNATTSRAMQRVVSENVIALIITPRLAKAEESDPSLNQINATHSPLAPDYSYDSTSTNSNPLINKKNQLPPVVQLTMIAMDEKSADKLNLDSTKADVFGISKLFSNTQNFAADLATLEGTLGKGRVPYRIFTTNVHIRAAKWSREQAN